MNTKTVARCSAVLLASLLAFALPTSAQIYPGGPGIAVPVVTIRATDPSATWAGDPGVFTVLREGDTNLTLNIFYRISGTASNGVDYVAIGNWIVIPAGERTNTIKIAPIDAGQTVTKTVSITLVPSPLLNPVNYIIGNASNAVVYISVNGGLTNVPPAVKITNPANGAAYRAPVNIPLYAYAADPDDAVASVEFFADGVSLGLGRTVLCPFYPICFGCLPRPCPTNNFVLTWTNAPIGTHLLRALATDSRGAMATSAPVSVVVLPAVPPPTNSPAIVSVVASDPLAIEGTNCYVWPVITNVPVAATSWSALPGVLRTNCGPKNAVFTIRRLGVTNAPLTVAYDLGGTATNGVDYLPLPGTVTINAGERTAQVVVVPIDDGPPDVNSSVILRLRPSATAPADYLVGYPARAAAVILDGPSPRPVTAMLADRCFHLNAAGPDGAWFRVEYTTDLLNWNPLCTNQVVNGSVDFIDPDAATEAQRMYRAVPEAGAPLE